MTGSGTGDQRAVPCPRPRTDVLGEHGWRIRRVEDHAHRATASAERMEDETLMDDLMQVQHCATLFGVLRPEAMSPRASRDLIRKAEEEPDGEA